MTPPPEDKWYKDGLRFECRRCGKCCGGEPGFVWVTGEDIRNIAAALGISAEEVSRRYVRRIGARLSLREKANGDCVMLQEHRCTIYHVRPVQCRTFPFWPSNLTSREAWDEVAAKCPGAGSGKLRSIQEIEDALARKF